MVSVISYLLFESLRSLILTIFVWLSGTVVVSTRMKQLSGIAKVIVSFCIGLALFGGQAYLFGWVGFRSGGWAYLIGVLLLSYNRRDQVLEALSAMRRALATVPRIILMLVMVGAITQALQMIGNGLPMAEGARYYRTNAYDGIFHIGLIESMKSQFPPQEPSTSGLAVKNYHYWSDLIFSEQSKLFDIPSQFLFFQWMPLLLSALTGLAAYECIRSISRDQAHQFQMVAGIFTLILLYLGSDAGWIFPLYLHRIFTFTYPAIDNGPTQFLNMPHTFGKLFFYAVGLLFVYWRREKKRDGLIWGLFLTAVCFGLKIYFGIILSIGWMMIFAFDTLGYIKIMKRGFMKGLTILHDHIFFGVLFVGLVGFIYLPVNRGAGGLSWYPLEWPKLMVNRDNFDWTTLNYKIAIAQYTHNLPKSILYNGVLVGVGMVAIFGARALGVLLSKSTVKIFTADGILFFFLPALVCTFLGMSTLQVSGGFNVFNFFVVSMPAFGFSLALLMARLIFTHRKWGIALLLTIVLCSLPRSLFETSSMIERYRFGTDSVLITPELDAAFSALHALPDSTSVVISSPENPLENKSTYIRAFAGKSVYFAGKYLLETHAQPFSQSEQNVRRIYNSTTVSAFTDQLSDLGIRYVWIDLQSSLAPIERLLMSSARKAVFANQRILIYDRMTL